MLKKAIIISICLVAVGCGGPKTQREMDSSIGPYPSNWKEIVASYIRNNYVDPYSIMDSEAAPPFMQQTLAYDRWIVCIRNNAKNRMGGYTGRKITEISIVKGQVDMVDDKNDLFCRDARFEPFPLNFK